MGAFCVAEGYEGKWEAFCLNFDLAVQGDSFDSVRSNLGEAIELFLETVRDLPEADRKRLLSRRAPLSQWLYPVWHLVKASLTSRDDRPRHDFTLPRPTNAAA
jgi:predicted RNase H-like HicB family nuclease